MPREQLENDTFDVSILRLELPPITKITNGIESNVTISSQRSIKSYGQAILGLVQHMKVHASYFVLTPEERKNISLMMEIYSLEHCSCFQNRTLHPHMENNCR